MTTNRLPNVTKTIAQDRKYFTLDQANSAIPYVSRVVADLCQAYGQATEYQQRIEFAQPDADLTQLRIDYEQMIDKLNRYVDELSEMGVELKDYELGLVDFPAIHEDREISICWKLGEPKIIAWHETHKGFSGRRDIDELSK